MYRLLLSPQKSLVSIIKRLHQFFCKGGVQKSATDGKVHWVSEQVASRSSFHWSGYLISVGLYPDLVIYTSYFIFNKHLVRGVLNIKGLSAFATKGWFSVIYIQKWILTLPDGIILFIFLQRCSSDQLLCTWALLCTLMYIHMHTNHSDFSQRYAAMGWRKYFVGILSKPRKEKGCFVLKFLWSFHMASLVKKNTVPMH